MKKIIIAALLSVLVVTPALADNTGRFYVAGDLGSASYSNAYGVAGTFPNPGVFRIAGGYHFSPMLAVEVGYSMFGDSVIDYGAAGKDTLKVRSFTFAAVGSLPLNTQFDITGKLGLAHNSLDASTTVPGFVGLTQSQSDLLIGLGAQYHVNSQLSLRLQYENFGKFDNTSQPMKATAISLGVAYNF